MNPDSKSINMNPKYNSITVFFLLVIIAVSGYFIYVNGKSDRKTNVATVFDFSSRKEVNTKLSANIIASKISKLQNSTIISGAQGLGLTNYFYTMYGCQGTTNNANNVIVNNFAQSVGARIDTYFNILASDSEFNCLINTFNPQFVIFSQETQGQRGQNYVPNDQYVSLAYHFMDLLAGRAIPVIDTPPTYKTNGDAMDRQHAVAAMNISGTADSRTYMQFSPDRMTFTSDQNSNFSQLDNYFTNTLPSDLNTSISYYPNLAKIAVLQWHAEDAGSVAGESAQHYVSQTALGNWSFGKSAEFVLSHTDKFDYLAWMSFDNLFNHDNTPGPEYYSLARITPLFKSYKYVQTYNFNLDGVTGLLFSNDDNNDAFLINNKTANTYTISHTDIPVSGSFIRDTGWANSWIPTATNEIVTEGDILVRPYSTSVVKFTMSTNDNSDNTPPVITNIKSRTSRANAVISWHTDELSSTKLEYGTTNAYGTSTNETDTNYGVSSHRINLSNLSLNTTYHYRVISTDSSGNTAFSADQVFVTPLQ